ncbi:MAG TPA: serine hydrolase [Blastocatellia bacterium]
MRHDQLRIRWGNVLRAPGKDEKGITFRAALALVCFVSMAQWSQGAFATALIEPSIVPPSQADTISRLQSGIPRLMEQGDVPGLSIALISDGKIAWNHAFGVKHTSTGAPVTDETVFEAASLSKPVFAYGVLKLADQGRIDLDAPLSKYLPNYIEGDDRINQITARMVLSHRTGFPNWRQGSSLKIYFTPGERFSYSGEGFVYLGKVVERITGEHLSDFLKSEVLAPLGMTNSSYVWLDEYNDLCATGHDEARSPVLKSKPTAANPASSLHTTALDYSKFVIALINGSGLKPGTAREMLSPQVKLNPKCTNCILTPPADLSNSLAWGLGIGLELAPDDDWFWHWGDNGAFKCFVMASPKQKAGVVIFTDSTYGLSIIPDIVDMAIGGQHPALDWIKYDRYDSPTHRFLKEALKNGADSAVRQAHADDDFSRISQGQLNTIGYILLRHNLTKAAITVFDLNVRRWPDSSNVYDSLAEAYFADGQKDLAIKNYQRSLDLDPGNQNAIRMLKKIEGK